MGWAHEGLSRAGVSARRILEGRHKTGRERGLDIISGYKSTVRSESNWMVPCVGEQCDE